MVFACGGSRATRWPLVAFPWLLSVTFLVAGVAHGAPASRPAKKSAKSSAMSKLETSVERLLASREFKKAEALLLAQLRKKPSDEGIFFLSRAQLAQKKYAKAAKTALSLAKRFPKSRYREKAALQAADALAMARKFARSQALYAKQIAALLSTKQRLAIAGVFLRFARRYAKKKPGKPARWSQSIKFYKRALAMELPEPHRRKIALSLARTYLKSGSSWWRARAYARLAAKRYKKGPHADEFKFIYARILMKRQYRNQARPLLRDLIADFPKSRWLPDVYMLLAKTYGVPAVTSAQYLALGIETLQELLKRFAKHKLRRTAAFMIATAYYRNGRYDKAVLHARAFIDSFGKGKQPTGAQARYVALSRYRIGQCYVSQKRFDRAIKAFQAFLKEHPTDRAWPKAQRQIITARYAKAQLLFTKKKWKQARAAFLQFLKRYPIDGRNAWLMWQLGSIEQKQKRPKAAIEAWQRLVSKYPTHRYGRRARWDIAQLYETALHDYAKALAGYRKISFWRFRTRARVAIQRLTSKSLAVRTTRTFTTKDTPFLEARTRNLKTLQVRMYQIDPETYFRKMRRFDGMNKLDIQLIRPDKTWNVKVKGFRKHHQHKVKIMLPAGVPKVAVYHVSGGKLAATTVAIVSDLQILSKINRRSMFVYALNSTTKKPMAGIRLLISDGKKILHVGKTDGKGVFQKRMKSLRSASRIRVLALSGRSVAASDNSLSGISYGRDLQLAGVVFTDRPVYRPGEVVFIRSIIREVKDGKYQLPTRPYRVEVSGPDGRVIFRRKRKPGPFGSFHLSFSTDPSSPTGYYAIKATAKGGGTFVGRFRIKMFSMPKYRLSFVLKKRVFQRRQIITGKVLVRFGFGAPAANRQVRVLLGSMNRKGRTNAKGELAFSFPSRELSTNRSYPMVARLQGERASTQSSIWLRSSLFELGLSTIRKVYAAGESIEVKVGAVDPSGKKYATKAKLAWFRLTKKFGQRVETKVGELDVNTNHKGIAKATIAIKQGGAYVIRASTKDALKQPVTASMKLSIAGKDGKQALQLLSDKERAQVGDTINVKLLVRKPGMAFITYETDEVLYHRLIPVLAKGEVSLPIKVTSQMSPNFALRIALFHKQKLLMAEKSFLISKRLKLEASIKEKNIRPGGWATLVVRAKDQKGKGVKAEVSIAVVDRALFDIFADKTPTLASVFYAYKRALGQSTRASHTYSHRAYGKRLSDALTRFQFEPSSGASAPPMAQQAKVPHFYRSPRLLLRRAAKLNINIDGPIANLNMGKMSTELQKKLFEKGLRRRFATTAYWNPTVITDDKGFAKVRFRMPDNAATWRVIMRGVAKPTLVGDAKIEFQSKKSFLVSLRMPDVVTEGDQLLPAAIVHNRTNTARRALVVLSVGALGITRRRIVSVPANRSKAVSFGSLSTTGAGGRIVQVKLAAVATKNTAKKGSKGAPLRDAVAGSLTIRTPGVLAFSSKAGVSNGNVDVTLKLPGRGPYTRQALRVSLGPVSSLWLTELARNHAGSHHYFPGMMVYRAAMTERVLRYLKQQQQGATPAAKQLKRQLDVMCRSLWMQQLRHGGWSFIGRKKRYLRDHIFSATVFSVLAKAHYKHGLFAPTNGLKRARRFVKKGYHKLFSVRAKATIVAALGLMSGSDQHELFSYAYRLYRSRTRLDLESLAQLSLALMRLKRPQLAKELVPYLEKRMKAGASKRWSRKLVALPYAQQMALALEVLASTAPASKVRKDGVKKLLSSRHGRVWGSLPLTQRAVGALAAHYGLSGRSGIKLKIFLQVDGKKLKQIPLNRATPGFSWLHYLRGKASSRRVVLRAVGRGSFHYAIRYEGYTKRPGRSLRSRYYVVRRKYTPSYRKLDGRTFVPGYHIVRGSYLRYKRVVKRLPIGDHTRVELKIKRPNKRRAEDLVVDEAIPGGAFVLPSSISVPNGHFVLEPGRIRFYLHHNARYWHIRYQLFGKRAGRYHIPATRVWSFADPGRLSLGTKHTLEILPANTKMRPHYPMTPAELLEMGKAHYKAGRKGVARGMLQRLVNRYKLKAHASRKAAKMLLQIAFEQGPQESIVRYFEMRKELDPDAILPFNEIVKVGKAYAVQGEHERATQVYQATLQAHFLNTLQVAGTLEREGKFEAARAFIETLLWRYPDAKPLREASYGLAQTAYQQATKNRTKPKKYRVWMAHAERLMRLFVKMYPTDPTADTAAYTRANILLELKRKADAIRYLALLGRRYPKSNELDSIHYLHAYALYLKRKSLAALELLKRVSTQRYPNGSGGTQRSKHRYLATYLIAQLHHANNKLARALNWYQKVKRRFADAGAQVRHFQKVQLIMPEVTTLGAKGKAVITIKHQNIKKLTILAYRVDLMKLYLHKKNLNAVTKINLAGIRPTYQGVKVIATGSEFNVRTTKLPLALAKRGAYLIVLKSAEREVSGILLRTSLQLEVLQDVSSGRVTAYLLRRQARTPAANALTRIIGSSDNRMQSGKTDLRGIYSAQNMRGFVTIIAQVGDDFAFFRGKQKLQPSWRRKPRLRRRWRRLRRRRRWRFKKKMKPAMKKNALPRMLEHINRGNYMNQSSGRRQMLDLYQRSRKGVQMKYFK